MSQILPRLSVQEPWLSYIATGVKTVEGRAGPAEKFARWIGHRAIFYSAMQEVVVEVLDVHHYDTLDEYLAAEGWQKVAPHLSSLDGTIKAYLGFYSRDKIKSIGGMNGIVVRVVG